MSCHYQPGPRVVPLFPLNPVTLFPHLLVPLHIFEPRYFEMVSCALNSHESIAMAHVVDPNAEIDDPPLRPIVGVGHIERWIQIPGRRYHIVLRGMVRGQIVEEKPRAHPYREARILRLHDGAVLLSAKAERELRVQVLDAATAVLARQLCDGEKILREHIIRPGMDLGMLCDQIAATVSLDPDMRYELLEELDPVARSERLLAHLAHRTQVMKTDGPCGHLFPRLN
ncbi:MAG: LON peptidase substrate-binding domain-containing protein [Planctomycetota bacterium]